MSTLITLMEESTDFYAFGPVDDRQIMDAENTLKVKFSNDYKEYVRSFGAATVNHIELTGICKSERLNVVSVTQHARSCYKNFPQDAYVIEDLLIDHVFIIQNESGNVFCYGPSDDGKKVSASLVSYLFPEHSD